MWLGAEAQGKDFTDNRLYPLPACPREAAGEWAVDRIQSSVEEEAVTGETHLARAYATCFPQRRDYMWHAVCGKEASRCVGSYLSRICEPDA